MKNGERSGGMESGKLKDVGEVVEYINEALSFIKEINILERGYMCGLVNGMRFIKYKITGEQPIFERNDAQPKAKRRIETMESLLEDLSEQLENKME